MIKPHYFICCFSRIFICCFSSFPKPLHILCSRAHISIEFSTALTADSVVYIAMSSFLKIYYIILFGAPPHSSHSKISPYHTDAEILCHVTTEFTDEYKLSADTLCTFLHPLSALALLQNNEKLLQCKLTSHIIFLRFHHWLQLKLFCLPLKYLKYTPKENT